MRICWLTVSMFSMNYKALPIDAIKEAPTVDAVEVIRCRDCEYFKLGDYCTQDKMEHSKCREDDFCSYAKCKMNGIIDVAESR